MFGVSRFRTKRKTHWDKHCQPFEKFGRCPQGSRCNYHHYQLQGEGDPTNPQYNRNCICDWCTVITGLHNRISAMMQFEVQIEGSKS
jgi:hypothetical protein